MKNLWARIKSWFTFDDRIRVTLVYEPEAGLGALYVDGVLAYDFGSHDPLNGGMFSKNGWEDALETMFDLPAFDRYVIFEYEQRWQLSYEINSPFDPPDYDSYWPHYLKDCPVIEVEEPLA